MLDADPPDRIGTRAAPKDDVTARVDRVVPHARPVEDQRAKVDGPALDQPGGVEDAARTRVEVAVRLLAEPLAAVEDPADVPGSVGRVKVTPRDPADLALRLVRGERQVDLAEPLEEVVEHAVVDVFADVDDDRHA